MINSVTEWLFGSGLTPHGFCLAWRPGLIWTYAISDVGIAVAYFSIPVALALLARRRQDLVFRPIFWLFAAFILLCGTTHWLDVLTLWVPAYGTLAVVKAATAVVSLVTAAGVWWLLPLALKLPSVRQWEAASVALAESEARHRASFQRSPVPLYTVDGNDVITAVSESWLDLFDYTENEVLGRPIAEFRAPGSMGLEPGERLQLLREGELRDQERHFLRRDGSLIEALVSARVDGREGGMAPANLCVVCVLMDVTARRQAEAALRLSEERLQQAQKMEAIGQLTGGIAHDFNNMLQAIGGCLDRMDRLIATGRTGELGRYVGAARGSVERAANLTYRMLAFARRQPLQATAVEPDTLVHAMGELIRRTLGPSVDLRLSLHDGVWSCLCDANQLESALLNLAINARDAMPEGGTLTIATADKVLGAEDLTGQPEVSPGGYVEFVVTDTGQGMPPEVLARVFEPFFTTKPIGQGTGLGLSQVYGFARQSGGVVLLDSEPGRGTKVRLYLPRHADVRPRGDRAEVLPLTRRPVNAEPLSGTVLVVDDETTLRALIAEALVEAGCGVIEAGTAAEGLEVLRSGAEVDLLISDIGLPGLDGQQMAEMARELRPGLPVLLMTGFAGTAMDCADVGAGMEVLRKPFGLDALCQRAAALLGAEEAAECP